VSASANAVNAPDFRLTRTPHDGRNLVVEFGQLVSGGPLISTSDDVDKPGVRTAVAEKGSPDAFLTPP